MPMLRGWVVCGGMTFAGDNARKTAALAAMAAILAVAALATLCRFIRRRARI